MTTTAFGLPPGATEGDEVIYIKGEKGEKGEGVPVGGNIGQVLAKASNTDYITEWTDLPGNTATDVTYDNTTSLLTATNAQQAIDELASEKANDSDVVHDTGNETIAGIKTFSSSPVVPDSSFTISKTTGLQTALDAKSNLAGTNTFTGVNTFTSPLITNGAINFNAPEGFLINGKIVPSVASGNLTVALKTLAGTDASASNPIYVMIGGVMRTITSALSLTRNAGNNILNMGSSELATKEVDLFAYLFYYPTTGAVVIAYARIPNANTISDLSYDALNEKGFDYPYDGNLPPSSTSIVNIGRFAATLSAGAGYTWSIPTYTASNLIQRPIYETRTVVGSNWTPTLTWNGTAPTGGTNKNFVYNLVGDKCYISGSVYNMTAGVANSLLTVTLPFAARGGAVNLQLINSMISNGATPNLTMGEINYYSTGLSINCSPVNATYLQFQGFYNI